jgi:glycosyltransferase involved in cell wall biosynthesis/GT2 family glycosyltransferase
VAGDGSAALVRQISSAGENPVKEMKICLVCNEILGAHRNGGIGTATSHLAILLARNGHSVTLFYVGDTLLDPFVPWASYYEAAHVTVCHYPGSQTQISPPWMRQAVEIYEQLQYRSFDIILFQDWLGLGHAGVIAKHAGLAFHRTTLAVIAHSVTPWLLEANQSFPQSRAELALIHLERQAIEYADAVVSPSLHLMNWLGRAGWTLPGSTSVIPYFLEGPELLGAVQLASPARKTTRVDKPSHLVFFGRLEERKGISIFLAALTSEELKNFRFKLTFLGRPATKSIEDVRGFVATHRSDLMAGVDFQPHLSSDEAQALLSSRDCIPVMPSLVDNSPCVIYECLKLRLPFVAASSGGIPELIHAGDRDRCLFDPTPEALARKLRGVLSSEFWESARPSYDQREIGERWLAWFEQHAPKQQAAKPIVSKPLLRSATEAADTTVVITHFERPQLVEQNLRALAMQSDKSFDVVLVDDGSQSEAALAFLDRVGCGIAGLPLKVVRQSNKYLGAARNEGIRNATGSFVIFLDDDNIPFPNMVEVFRRAAHATDADIVTCQMQFFRNPTGGPDLEELLTGERWAFPGGPVPLAVIQNCFGDATAIYKRDLFERLGYFHELPGVTFEDWQLHLRACLEGFSLISLPLPLFWYRITPGSMIKTTNIYANLRVVASAFHKKIPPSLFQLVDFMIGTNYQQR